MLILAYKKEVHMEEKIKQDTIYGLRVELNGCKETIDRLKKEVQHPREESGMGMWDIKKMKDRIDDLQKWALVWRSLILLMER